MTRSATFVALAIALAAVGCSTRTAGQIPVARPASIPAHAPHVRGPAVTGTVVDTTGRPVAGATVLVAVSLSDAEAFAKGTAALASLGLSCTAGCLPAHSAGFTARDGSFAAAVPADNPNHDAYTLTVAAAHGTARVATSIDLPRSARHGKQVGTVVIARDGPAVRRSAATDRVVPPPPPSAQGATPPRAFLNTETGSPPVISGSQIDVTAGYDPRLLEDEHLLLTTEQAGSEHGRRAIFSSSLEVHGNVVPGSRDASCSVTGSRGQSIAQRPCGLTDGDLDSAWQPHDDARCQDGPCRGPVGRQSRQVTITLRHPVSARLVVVRGCIGCTIATSADRRQFTSYATRPPAPDDIVTVSPHGTTVAAVRITTDTGGFFSSLREVSVFAGKR